VAVDGHVDRAAEAVEDDGCGEMCSVAFGLEEHVWFAVLEVCAVDEGAGGVVLAYAQVPACPGGEGDVEGAWV